MKRFFRLLAAAVISLTVHGLVLAAISLLSQHRAEPPPESRDGPSLEPKLGFNPFYVIEAIVGKSIPEILNLDD